MTFDYASSSKPEQIAYDAGLKENEFAADQEEEAEGVSRAELVDTIRDLDEWLRLGLWTHGISPRNTVAHIVRRLSMFIK